MEEEKGRKKYNYITISEIRFKRRPKLCIIVYDTVLIFISSDLYVNYKRSFLFNILEISLLYSKVLDVYLVTDRSSPTE